MVHGKEVEIEYEKKIIDKINSFFGYNCVSHIILKIAQDRIVSNSRVFRKIKNFSQIEEKMDKVSNNKLKNSLSNFLKAFNEKKT